MLPIPFNTLPARSITAKTLNRGEVLFRQSDTPRFLYFLKSGHIQLLRHTKTGEKLVIHNAGAKQIFAEASLFSSTYHCDAAAKSDTHLIAMDKLQILKSMRQNSMFAFALATRFANEIQSHRRRLELLSIKSAPKRVHTAIAEGMLTGSVMTLATDIGLTHEATYRALSYLTNKEMLVKTGRGRYELPSQQIPTTG